MRRVVKKDCNRVERLASSIEALPSLFQPLPGRPQQFRRASQIPVRVGDMGVAEIRGQDRQAPLGIFAVSIPAQQSLGGKSVTKIVQARAATAPRSTQSNLSRQDVEHPVDFAFVQPVAILIHEKVRLCSRAKATVPLFGVVGQDLTGRGMQRYQTGLAKLGSPNG